MADSTNPNASKPTSSAFLPRFYRSDANKKFLQATVDQLIQPGTVQKVNGYVGRQNAKSTKGSDIFVQAADVTRQNYQLEPGLVVKDDLDNVTFFKDYIDYINQIEVFGGNIKNHARLNKQEFYSWDPHISWDMFVNFQNYYWLPYGPDTVRIYGQAEKIASTYDVIIESQLDNNAYIFSPEGTEGLVRNPVIKLYRGQTYKFNINSPGNPFSIKTARSSGIYDRYESYGLENNSIETGVITFTVSVNAPDVLYYQSEIDVDLGGVFQIMSIEENSKIDVEKEILGKKSYTLSDGTPLTNGMKITFGGIVTPETYATGFYYVEGVGTAIQLVNSADLELISPYTQSESVLFDTTPFDSLPFGDATSFAGSVDYIVINRSSKDRNPWSRYNRWFHKNAIESSAKYNGKIASLDQSKRAVRPIIEFEPNLKLFNFGTTAVADVDLIDTFTTDVFSTIEGSLGYNIDGVPVSQGQRILFTADTDRLVKNKIYRVDFIDVLHYNEGSRQIHLVPVDEPVLNQVVLVRQGIQNQGQMYWFNGDTWKLSQQKTSLNQPPLFDIVDDSGTSFSNIDKYDGSTFAGTKLFSYKVGTGSADSNLGFALSYKNIDNIGDIVFNFNLETDTFQWKDLANVIQQPINSGYLVKTINIGNASYVNGWQVNTSPTIQAAVRIYKDSNKTNNFDIDIFDDINDLSDLTVRVYINGIRLESPNWTVVNGSAYKKIILNNDIELTDVLTIRAFAKQPINKNGYYEIPVNLQNNPLNESILDFTLGEVIDHVNTIVDNVPGFTGEYPGPGNLRDLGNITQYGTRFLKHSGPASLSLYHITSQTNNVVRAVEKSRDDYNKFKKNFIAVAETLGVDADPISQVNLILQRINKDKPKTSPYYFSDMVPYGAYTKNSYTVVDYRIKNYPLTQVFNLDTLSNRAVCVYHNNTQLSYGRQYSFDNQGFVVINSVLANDDVITIYEYENTDGCFVPETPTKLGMWPKFEPKLYLDTSLVTPRMMIQGHDGSQVLAYGDFRDDLILELEKRIYNNIKVQYDPNIFDICDIIPSYNRTTDYSLKEFNEILAPSFYKWTELIDRDFTKPLSFDRTNSMTFNYRGHTAPDGRETPGYWRGIYRWMLDTDRPNICPWEMLGFCEEPNWWQDLYGPAPYTSDNRVMWQDIADGIVREPGKPLQVREKFKKPFLMNHIPVNQQGEIISPLMSGLSTGIITTSTEGDFVFGDVSPIEGAWRRSSYYPFSIVLAALLMTPAKTFGVLLDRSRVKRNLTGQLIYGDTNLCITPKNIILPSTTESESRNQTAGIINYLVNYVVSDNLNSFDLYAYDLANIGARISYRVGGFTSKEKFNLLLDSKSPTATGSVFVPKEDFEVILNSSSPIKKITYSGVIVTKLTDGFEVKGYSKTQPFFKYYPWLQSGTVINVGGISEGYSTWTPGQQYASGKIVAYNNRYYRSKVLHTSKSVFEVDKYQPLPSLPIIGGREAILRNLWDRTETITVPYGTKFRTIQEVVDFLLGYGEWLKDQGFIFDEFNTAIEQVTNWETSAKEFLFWTTQNWSTGEDKWKDWDPTTEVKFGEIVRFNGDYYRAIKNVAASEIFDTDGFVKLDGLSTVGSSVISLSPAAVKLTFKATQCVVDDIRNPLNTYEIFGVDGKPIPYNFLNSFREDNAVSYTPAGEEGIYGATFYLVQKEQVVILNNSTMFNDTIYNLPSGYKQDRIKVAGYVSAKWDGSFDVPGFIFDSAKIQNWEVWKDYALGDIVKYKEFYYSAKGFTPGTNEFEPTSWYKLDEKPTAQLLPNWTYKASQFTDFYDLDSDNFDVSQQKMAQHLIGYQKRQYLENIIQDDVSEFKFYQGMILEKGTQNVFNKLFDVLSVDGKESLNFHEEWAVRTGRYGASAAYDNIEFVLDEGLFKNNPQGIELVTTVDKSKFDFIIRQTPNDVYLKPLGYNSAPWPVNNNYKPYLRTAGHPQPSEVLYTVKTIDNITDKDPNTGEFLYPISTFKNGDYVYCTFDKLSWNVYRYTDCDLTVTDIVYADNKITITTEELSNIHEGTYIGLSQLSSGNGFYKVISVSLNTTVVEAATDPGIPVPFTDQSSVLFYKFVSQKVDSIDNIDSVLPAKLNLTELVWAGGPGTGDMWSTWKFSPVYNSGTLPISSPSVGLNYGRALASNNKGNLVAVSTAEGEIVTFDKASPASPWLQRQTIVRPFIAANDELNINPNNPEQIASVLAISADGRWLATGSPTVGFAVAMTNSDGLTIADPDGTVRNLTGHGVVSIYEKDNNNIYSLVCTVLSPTPANNEKFGSSIAFAGDTLYVGAIGYGNPSTPSNADLNVGRVYRLKYETQVKVSTPYNPFGSSGKTIVLSSVAGIVPGMGVQGPGFTSGQTVVSVSPENNSVVISSIPDSDPTGSIVNFTTTGWVYDLTNTVTGASSGSNYGDNISVSTDGSVVAISAPGSSTNGVQSFVEVYRNGVSSQVITSTDPQFGQGVAISAYGDCLAISSILHDGEKTDQGQVTVYELVNGNYVYDSQLGIGQQLVNRNPETAQYFGSKIAFANNYTTLIVYSSQADTYDSVTFNADQSMHPTATGNPTTFDEETTSFVTWKTNSGRVDIYDRYSKKWVFSESLSTENTEDEGYGQGFAVSSNHVFVGAPSAFDSELRSGKVYEYSKPNGVFSWTKIREEIAKPDLKKIKKAFLYNKRTNTLIGYLDVIDPSQGKIPGIAEQELTYKTFYDPATYTVGTSAVNVDDGTAWTDAQVGKLWWDLRNAKFVDSFSSDIVYRNSVWNKLAVGASIDVYEWVKTPYLPSEWNELADTEEGLAAGISGTSLYGDDVYSQERKYDNVSSSFTNTYYYWVKNKTVVPDNSNRFMSASDVAGLIENPRGEGYRYLALTGLNSFSLVNVKPLLEASDVVLSVEYWTVDNTNQNIHAQWKIISSDPKTTIPQSIEDKWFDSLCGKDVDGRPVPDTSLPVKIKYGIENRPRQGMFVNRFEALKQLVERANIALKKIQISSQADISLLNTFDKEPSLITGLYDAVFDTNAELRFASVGSFKRPTLTPLIKDGKIVGAEVIVKGSGYLVAPYVTVSGSGSGAVLKTIINSYGQITGVEVISSGEGYDSNTVLLVRDYSVLVHSDSEASGVWSVYSYDPALATWSRVLSQTYDTRNYWDYIDWYASGYNQFSAPDFAVDTLVGLNSIDPAVGELVKVKTNSAGKWILLEKYSNTISVDWTQQYKVVGIQDGTIQLSSSLYDFMDSSVGYDGSLYDGSTFDSVASVELRNILITLRDSIFVDDLKSTYLDLFFACVRYAFSEQTYIDWIFKTSFVKAQHNTGELKQTVSYKNDNLTNFEDYVNEVKPFRTKVREYVSGYSKVEPASLSVTDFDLQPVYEDSRVKNITTTVNNGKISADDPAILSYPWKHWYDNVGFEVTSIAIVDGGSEYQFEPVVRIISDSGSGAVARAFIANGKVTRIVILNKGKGYLAAPTIVIDGGHSAAGTQARAVAIIGNSVVRSSLIKMKFDRITQTYFITQLEETETFVGSGSRLQWPLTWAPDIRVGKATVMINGVEVLRDSYKLLVTKSTTRGYTSYAGSIVFDTAVAAGAEISVTYIKNWELLNAADRIQYYYNPAAGELGKDLTQLMTGIDYGGVVVSGLGFEINSGWDSTPFYSDKWGSFDETYDDYITTVEHGTTGFTLPYVPPVGTKINVYQSKNHIDSYISDGSTVVYKYNFEVQSPKVTVVRHTTTLAPTTTKNISGSFILSVLSTATIRPGDVVTTSINGVFGYNTVVEEILNGTDIRLNQIIFAAIPTDSPVTFTHELLEPVYVNLYANGTMVLTEPVAEGSIINVTGMLAPVRLDDENFGTADQTNQDAVMTTWIGDGESSTVTIPNTVVVSDNDRFILRRSDSDGSIKPQETDYDTALTGGNLAYSSATGLAADDIIVDGDGFVTPTTSPAPEEVVPGQVVDSVAIRVFDKPSRGSANIKVDNYIADGSTTEFKVTQRLNSPQAVIVKTTSGTYGNPLVSTIKTVVTDFTVDYSNQLIVFNEPPAAGDMVTIFSFGFNGYNILDLDYFIGNNATDEFITKAPWLSGNVTALVYIDGEPAAYELFQTDATYDSEDRVGIRFRDVPNGGALINYVIVSGSTQSFSITKTERIVGNGSTTYDLEYIVGNKLPAESNMIVRVDQEILKSPNNSYYTIKNNRLNYNIDPLKFVPYSVDINDIVVLADGIQLSYGLDYTIDLGGITIKINKLAYKKYAGKELIISVRQALGYVYVPGTGSVPPKITFAEPYDNTRIIEVISSYNHDVLDIQRTAISVTENVQLTPDSIDYYNYKNLASGRIVLDRPVIDDSYVWITKNGKLLVPSADFKVNTDRSSVQLAQPLNFTDEITLITYSSNVLTTGISYMQFKDMLNRVHFKRLSLNKQTRLARDLRINDTFIEVEDASNFDIPNPAQNKPGVIEIFGERIEYFTLNGNVLGQIRRGTLGTGARKIYRTGTFVQDIGPSESLPYVETSIVKQVVSDGSDIIKVDFTPMAGVIESGHSHTTVSDWNNNGYTSSIPATYYQADDIEVFVGGYDTTEIWEPNTLYSTDTIVTVGSYNYRCVAEHTSSNVFKDDANNWQFFIGNIRLKKHPYYVYNVNGAPNSPEGDIQLDADFAVDGVSNEILLTNKLNFGTYVTVVKRTGTVWDSSINIQQDNSKIANFLKATPGIWYSEMKKLTVNTESSTWDSTNGTFDTQNTTFDQG